MSKSKKKQNKKQYKKEYSNKALVVFLCIIIVALSAVGYAIVRMSILNANNHNLPSQEFVPPEFDSGAAVGAPSVPNDMGYLEVYKEGMSFNAFVCGEVNIKDGKADIYFTNPEKNTLWMKLRIFDENGKVIAETGLIKPNEYLKTVSFDTVPKNNSKITMKIMTYEPNTYYSGGAVSLNTVAKTK